MGKSKHEQIIEYIKELQIGKKVSVRQIAKELEVSDGTAYRAIKEAESRGLVSSIPKVGTIRIETPEIMDIEDLTLNEISRIIEGEVIHGTEALNQTFSIFQIGTNSIDVIERSLEANSLFIVGNRPDAQRAALEKGATLLITDGLKIEDEIIELAKTREVTLISTPYDTFAVTAMINKALSDRLKEREIIQVEDVMIIDVVTVSVNSKVKDWYDLEEKTKHTRLPVIDDKGKVVGIITAGDIAGADSETGVAELMTQRLINISKNSSLSHAARMMTWEGVDLLPVVENDRLLGVISQQDIINAFQHIQKQPHVGDTMDNIIMSGFRLEDTPNGVKVLGEITNFMLNEFGSAGTGSLVSILNYTAYIALRRRKRLDMVADGLTLYYLQPIPPDSMLEVEAKILRIDKKNVKMEVEAYHHKELVAKALISGKI